MPEVLLWHIVIYQIILTTTIKVYKERKRANILLSGEDLEHILTCLLFTSA